MNIQRQRMTTRDKQEYFANVRTAHSLLKAAKNELQELHLNLHFDGHETSEMLEEVRKLRVDLYQVVTDLERMSDFRLEWQRIETKRGKY